MKKFIKIILIVLILVFIGITIYNISILRVTGLDKSNPMSKEEVTELCNKEIEDLNYMAVGKIESVTDFDRSNDFVEMKIYVKGKIGNHILNDVPFRWINLDTNEKLGFFYGEPIVYMVKLNENDKESVKMTLDFDSLGNKGYEYLGEMEFNGRPTIVVKVYDDKALIRLDEERYFIDKQTGVLVNDEFYYLNGPIYKKVSAMNYEIRFDCVTDEDVKRPNLDGYTVYDET